MIVGQAGQATVARPPVIHLRRKRLSIPAGGKRNQSEVILLPTEHIQRAAPDRSSRAEKGDAPSGS
jgi:hypothetical protein